MSAIFILKRRPPKNHKFFILSKGPYLVIGDPIDMNADLF